MADPVTRAAKPPAGKGKEFLGQPAWVWAAGAGAVILGYLYIRSKSSSPQQAGGGGQRRAGGGYGPAGWTTDTFKIWVRQHQGSPRPKVNPGGPRKGHGGDYDPHGDDWEHDRGL